MKTITEDAYTSISPPQVTELPSLPLAAPYTDTETDGADVSITIGSIQEPDPEPATISVYATSITPAMYSNDSPVVAFDVVFAVGITCPTSGNIETYQVVKRIGVDRQKLAVAAKASTPVSIVEAKQPKRELADIGVGASTARLKALAGLR